MTSFKKTFISPDQNISSAIEIIHKAGQRIGLVVKNSQLLGTITDGDIRRALLQNKDMNTPASEIMNSNPTIAKESHSIEEIKELMRTEDILQIPVINTKNKIIDLKLINDLEENKIENTVVIMAGGFGKRLLPLTENTPKPLLKIGKKPILEIIISKLKKFGFNRIIISTHYKSEMIKKYFKNGKKFGVEIDYLEESKPLGTAGALTLIQKRDLNHPLVVMNADLFTELNFNSLLENHLESNSAATACVVKYEFEVPYGVMEVKGNKIKKITEKPKHKFFISAGIYVLNPEIIKGMKKDEFKDMPELLSDNLKNEKGINMFPIFEEWLDIGRIGDFEKANSKLDG